MLSALGPPQLSDEAAPAGLVGAHSIDAVVGHVVGQLQTDDAVEVGARPALPHVLARGPLEVELDPHRKRLQPEVQERGEDPWVMNVGNGVVDLRTGELSPHDPARLLTKIAGADYFPEAEAPIWKRVVAEAMPDPDVRGFLQRALGYCCTGDVGEQKLFIPYGTGGNSKTTLMEGARNALGDYADQADPELLLARRDAHPTGIAKLRGKRFVVTSENDEGSCLAEGTVKRLTGGDRITARHMRQDFFEFPPTHKIWMMTNHRPQVRGTDHGIWRRLLVVPFEVTIPEEHKDKKRAAKLNAERHGILAWLVKGCLQWQRVGLDEPVSVMMATHAYRAENDVVAEFLGDCCTFSEGAVTAAASLYSAYLTWCAANGESVRSQRDFGQRLTERGLGRVKQGPQRRWHWRGIGLLVGVEANP